MPASKIAKMASPAPVTSLTGSSMHQGQCFFVFSRASVSRAWCNGTGLATALSHRRSPTTVLARCRRFLERMLPGRWTSDEHDMFVKSYEVHGRQWKLLAEVVSAVQCAGRASATSTAAARKCFAPSFCLRRLGCPPAALSRASCWLCSLAGRSKAGRSCRSARTRRSTSTSSAAMRRKRRLRAPSQ